MIASYLVPYLPRPLFPNPKHRLAEIVPLLLPSVLVALCRSSSSLIELMKNPALSEVL